MLALRWEAWKMPRMEVLSTGAATISMLVLREFATKLLKNGMTLKALKELLGHKHIKTTMRHGHLEASDVSPEAVRILNEQNAARRKVKKAA